MNIFWSELLNFLRIERLLTIIQSGDYQALFTLEGLRAVLPPLIIVIFFIEIIRASYYKKLSIVQYKMPMLIYVFNRVISRFITIAMYAFCIAFFSKYALFQTSFTWYWFIYSYIVWELAHFVYHYFGHKVRLFWCLHATHHVPEDMNLSVSYAHFFLEGAYADFIRTSICIVLGVNPLVLPFVMLIDGFWGDFIHISERMVNNARFGIIGKIILTPSHHRVHHARNHLYMDTNFCNLLNIWDRVFKTYQDERVDVKPEYGITRNVNTGNFGDVYFGEFYHLFKDVIQAKGLKNKLLYLMMPPGWTPTGKSQTAKFLRDSFLDNENKGYSSIL